MGLIGNILNQLRPNKNSKHGTESSLRRSSNKMQRQTKPGSIRKGSGQSSKVKLLDFEIPKGNYQIMVQGTQWCKIDLTTNKDRILSLTPKNKYQKDHEWPEDGIVNVNKRGSRRTTAKNWVGYIPAAQAQKLLKVVETHGTTSVHCSIEGNAVTLMIPEQYV